MAILRIERLIHIKEDGTEHHFYRNGEIYIPLQFHALPYNLKGRMTFDIVPEGIYRINDLQYYSEITQWVIFNDGQGNTYTRDSKMCLTWSIPEGLRDAYGEWRKYSPFRVVSDGVEEIFTAWDAVEKYLQQINQAHIYNGYSALKEYRK